MRSVTFYKRILKTKIILKFKSCKLCNYVQNPNFPREKLNIRKFGIIKNFRGRKGGTL